MTTRPDRRRRCVAPRGMARAGAVTGLAVALVCLAAQAGPTPTPARVAQAPAAAPSAQAAGRGQLLYETHCVACHTTQMHWRANRRVQDWAGLLAQVRQWQARAQLNWSDDDVQAVARHLNERIYQLPASEQRAAAPPAPGG